MKTKLLILLALAGCSVLNVQLWASPLGTAFTYQGVVTDNGAPATGPYDVQCLLYNAPTNGNQIGPILEFPNTHTDNGVCTVTLDFGSGVFNGEARWLEFRVRTTGSIGPYTTLVPRQELTPSPGAIWATTAGNLAPGTYAGAVNFNNDNNIFSGNGAGLIYVNADILDGYHGSEYARKGDSAYFWDVTAARLIIGNSSSVSGSYATVPGGYLNRASGDYSMAAGYRAKADHKGTFVWADSTAGEFASTGPNQFLIRATGGVGINTHIPGFALGVLGDVKAISAGTYAIIGSATNTTSGRNFGGSFIAAGSDGSGVVGVASGSGGYGIEGIAYGPSGMAVHGLAESRTGENGVGGWFEAEHIYSIGVYGKAPLGGVGVVGDGGQSGLGWDFDARGPGINYGATSSIRWKRDVTPIDEPLAKVMALRGVYFNWDAEHGGHHDVGMVAEEVGKVLPEIVGYETNGIDATGMDYSKLTPLLVEVGKALKVQVDELRQQQAEKDARISILESDLAELKAQIQTLLARSKER